jgi:copper chaperone CopZ
MKVILFNIAQGRCVECSIALKRFIGGIEGVESVDVGKGTISIRIDETKAKEDSIRKIARDSIERLGFRIEE